MPITLLAHGALGPYDEIVFISIALVFIAMMTVSWFRSQQLEDDDLEMNDSVPSNDHENPPEHFELR